MGYDENKMKALAKYSQKKYDSDEDLPEDQQKQIKDQENKFDDVAADKIRKDSWQNAGMFPKLKRAVKAGFSGDIREKTPEQDSAMENELARRKRLYGKS